MNALTELRSLCEVNLQALNRLPDGPRKLDLKASTLSHQAQAAESLGDPLKSIELNLQCYQIWLARRRSCVSPQIISPTVIILLIFTKNRRSGMRSRNTFGKLVLRTEKMMVIDPLDTSRTTLAVSYISGSTTKPMPCSISQSHV